MNTYSLEYSGSKNGNALWNTRLYPVVKTSRVLPSGLTTLLAAYPASHSTGATCASIGSVTTMPVSRNWKVEPVVANGVIDWPILGTDWGALYTVMVRGAVVLPPAGLVAVTV